uniref:Glutamate receptor n=1 Tax=Aegilops tauschii TaxID=37682 RepID=N1QRR7_AEGTA
MKATRLLRVLLLALALLVGASGAAAQGGGAVPRRRPRTVDVGVILDRTTWLGNMSWTCMELAMEDFYADAGHEYNATLRLHLRDTGPNAVDAAAAGTQNPSIKNS